MNTTYEDLVAMEGIFSRFFGHTETREDWAKDKEFQKYYKSTLMPMFKKAVDYACSVAKSEIKSFSSKVTSENAELPSNFAFVEGWHLHGNGVPKTSYEIVSVANDVYETFSTEQTNELHKLLSYIQSITQAKVSALTNNLGKIEVRLGPDQVDYWGTGIYMAVDIAEIYRNWQDERMKPGSSKENAPGGAPANLNQVKAEEAIFFSTERSQGKVTKRFGDMDTYLDNAITAFEQCIECINVALKKVTSAKDDKDALTAIMEVFSQDFYKAASIAFSPEALNKANADFKKNGGARFLERADFKKENIREIEKLLVSKCQNGGDYYVRLGNVLKDMETLADKLEAASIRYKSTLFKVTAVANLVNMWSWTATNINHIAYEIKNGVVRVDRKDGYRVDPSNEGSNP